MSTEFNPATFEHKGVVYEAKIDEHPVGCVGCAFDRGSVCNRPYGMGAFCTSVNRPDGETIIWVIRAQESGKP